MSEISINMILDGITSALHGAYPDSQIRSNEVTQGLSSGDFICVMISAQRIQRMGNRFRCTPTFDVIYFPTDKHKAREECYDVADTLGPLFNIITLSSGDKLRAVDVNVSFVDEVLHYQMTYPFEATIENELDPMETLTMIQEGV